MRILVLGSMAVWFCSCGYFHTESNLLTPIKEYGRWGYINNKGAKIIECQFDFASDFSEGLAAVEIDSLWGFINTRGEVVIKPKYLIDYNESAPQFSDGLCHVEEIVDSKKINLFIKKDGSVAFVSPYYYWQVGNFADGRAEVDIDREACYIDKKGNVVIKTGFPNGHTFSEGIARVWTQDSTHYIDTTGNVVVAIGSRITRSFSEGLAQIRDGNDYYIDKTGKRAITSSSKRWLVYYDFSDGLALVQDGPNGSGFIDKTGKFVIKPQYFHARFFNEGLCPVAVELNGPFGFIDKAGKMVIEPRFEAVDRFSNGLCWVKEGHQRGYIDRTGKYVWRAQIDVQYDKLDLAKWKLDTLLVSKSMAAHNFDGYDNVVRPATFEFENNLSLKLDTTDLTVYYDKYFAHKLYLINGTLDTVMIPVQDSRLKIIQQALNEKNEWQDLDIFINSLCGNSYNTYQIPPGGYQIFPAVFFKGSYKTRFRFKLDLRGDELYSNTYSGFMNKVQFSEPPKASKTQI